MNSLPLFELSVLMSFVAFGIVTNLHLAPSPNGASRRSAYRINGSPHVPVHRAKRSDSRSVSASLPSGFSFPAAYGDLFAAILAVLAIWSLSARAWFATSMVWVFNLWGLVDLLVAFYQGLLGVRMDPGWLSAAHFIPTVVVPPLLVTHGLMFWLLQRKPSSTRHQANATPKLAPS